MLDPSQEPFRQVRKVIWWCRTSVVKGPRQCWAGVFWGRRWRWQSVGCRRCVWVRFQAQWWEGFGTTFWETAGGHGAGTAGGGRDFTLVPGGDFNINWGLRRNLRNFKSNVLVFTLDILFVASVVGPHFALRFQDRLQMSYITHRWPQGLDFAQLSGFASRG